MRRVTVIRSDLTSSTQDRKVLAGFIGTLTEQLRLLPCVHWLKCLDNKAVTIGKLPSRVMSHHLRIPILLLCLFVGLEMEAKAYRNPGTGPLSGN